MNANKKVDYSDLMIFTENWAEYPVNIPLDYDKNNLLDFFDLALFANNWLINYQY